jgi:hypothetical protein
MSLIVLAIVATKGMLTALEQVVLATVPAARVVMVPVLKATPVPVVM